MKVDADILYGWSYFGISKIRIWVDDKNYFTMYGLMITNKFMISIKIGGGKRC